jgi:hypothetical protein
MGEMRGAQTVLVNKSKEEQGAHRTIIFKRILMREEGMAST